jgi:hypothetical protein
MYWKTIINKEVIKLIKLFLDHVFENYGFCFLKMSFLKPWTLVFIQILEKMLSLKLFWVKNLLFFKPSTHKWNE